ncbi:MAG: hypothetical protein NTV43_02980 [Methylococcales bacterium]|nr:hypothetical protein [Methylococcales bacterium]
MFNIIKLLFDICLFKKGPQDLPHSRALLQLLFLLYIVVRVLMLSIHYDLLNVLLQLFVEFFLVAAFFWAMLYLSRKLGRFYQVMAAVLGTDALISFFALPGIATIELGQGGLAVLVVMLALIGWHWAVTGHIIRNALDQSLSFSLGVAFLYLIATYQVMSILFPEVAVAQ